MISSKVSSKVPSLSAFSDADHGPTHHCAQLVSQSSTFDNRLLVCYIDHEVCNALLVPCDHGISAFYI